MIASMEEKNHSLVISKSSTLCRRVNTALNEADSVVTLDTKQMFSCGAVTYTNKMQRLRDDVIHHDIS